MLSPLSSPLISPVPYLSSLSEDPLWEDITPEKPKETPLPIKRMIPPLLIQLMESIAMTNVLPYAPFMVQDFLGLSDDDTSVGIYTGILDAAFPLGQLVSAYGWGLLSDKIGRKPPVLAGCLGTFACWLTFGFSVNLPMAMAMRFAYGFFNGNLTIIRTYLGEILDKTNQARGFSYYAFSFSIGIIIGPLVGGTLARPTVQYDGFEGTIFDTFPYLLPNLVCALVGLGSFFMGYFLMDESLEQPISFREFLRNIFFAKKDDLEDDTALHLENRKSRSPIIDFYHNQNYWVNFVLYTLLVGLFMTYQTIFPLWAKMPEFVLGFEWNTNDIGVVQAFGGPGMAIMQLYCYPRFAKRFGNLRTFQILCFIPAGLMFIYPALGLIPDVSVLRKAILCTWMFIFAAAAGGLFTANQILMINSVKPSVLGRAMGFCVAFSSILRAGGPAMGGSLFAITANGDTAGGFRDIPLFNRNAIMYFCGFACLFMFLYSFKIDKRTDSPPEVSEHSMEAKVGDLGNTLELLHRNVYLGRLKKQCRVYRYLKIYEINY